MGAPWYDQLVPAGCGGGHSGSVESNWASLQLLAWLLVLVVGGTLHMSYVDYFMAEKEEEIGAPRGTWSPQHMLQH